MSVWKPIESVPRGKLVLVRKRQPGLTHTISGGEPSSDGWYYNTAHWHTASNENIHRWADEWTEIPGDEDLKQRIKNAVEVIGAFGGHDGAHHKQWVLDQVVRALLSEAEYETWTNRIDGGEWDKGIAP
jgi:hypothetical protein